MNREDFGMKRTVAALVVALCAGGAGAQSVYKSTMPDGRVIYGEKPAPGASKVETIETPTGKTGMSAITPEERARAVEMKQRPAAPATAGKEGEEARLALKNAEAALAAGKEPLPGERLGVAGGGSRLSEGYFARQKGLEDAVAAARKRVQDTSR